MSDEQHSGGEDKSQEPTPQKLRKSREKGDVPYSTEVTAAATYAAFYASLIIVAGWSAVHVSSTLAAFFHRPDEIGDVLLSPYQTRLLPQLILRLSIGIFPLFLVLALAAIASILSQQAFTVALSKIKPKLSRISITDNAKQKYGMNGISEFVKSLAKLIAVLSIVLFVFKGRFIELPALSGMPADSIVTMLHREAIFFCGFITMAAVLIGAVDLPWRNIQHRNRLKMTLQEIKKENKETEGDPTLKSARRRRAEEIATNRMMSDVPKADIVIVNPTHYAVALIWDRKSGAVPVCVAKGVDEVAARIRETAAGAGVPIKRDPPTARSIFSLVKIGQEIRREHFAAVAAAIHYADEIRNKWRKSYSS